VLTKAAAAADALFKTIDRQSEIDPLSELGQVPSSCAGRIHIEGVNFSYPTRVDVPVLRNFSLSVPANSTTALVGESGSGKSTIVGLLGKNFPSFHGRIAAFDVSNHLHNNCTSNIASKNGGTTLAPVSSHSMASRSET
jgi:ATP-binding cassette subfamily B (MDR/TAP) protein 1